MKIERTDKEIIIRVSPKIDLPGLERILKYLQEKKTSNLPKDRIQESFGAWEGDESADDLIKMIRDSRQADSNSRRE